MSCLLGFVELLQLDDLDPVGAPPTSRGERTRLGFVAAGRLPLARRRAWLLQRVSGRLFRGSCKEQASLPGGARRRPRRRRHAPGGFSLFALALDMLMDRDPDQPIDQARLRRHLRDQPVERRRTPAEAVAEAEEAVTVASGAASGDSRQLRGIPAVGRSVSGAVPGSDPVQALFGEQAQRRASPVLRGRPARRASSPRCSRTSTVTAG
jgi:hypothetical protein